MVTTRRVLLLTAVAALIVGVLIAASGGGVLVVGGFRLSARSARGSLTAAIATLLCWAVIGRHRRALADDVRWAGEWLDRSSVVMLGVITIGAIATVAAFGTSSPSGADASGYLSQAGMWARGDWRVADVLRGIPGWPLDAGGTTPLGWRPALTGTFQVPTYAPGLPWLMAPLWFAGGDAAARLVIVLAAGAVVLATGGTALTLAGSVAAVVAASLVAASPTLLFHALVPMSDVPVTAAWMLCWWALVRNLPVWSGVAAAVAVLIRPNLAPLAVVPLAATLAITPPHRRVLDAAIFSGPVAVAGVLVAGIQWLWYGSPLRSGYGAPGELFTLDNVLPNAALYAGWMGEGERTGGLTIVLTMVLAMVRTGVRTEVRTTVRRVWIALAVFALGVVLAYLVYAQFETWTYLRFLLPALSVMAVMAGALVQRLVAGQSAAVRGWVMAGLAVLLVAAGVREARRLDVFSQGALTSRAMEAGRALAAHLPANAVMLAGEQSGAMRHLTGRPIVRWETLSPSRLREVLAVLRANGREAWWVLDQWEETYVRSRLGEVPEALLDWPPVVEAGSIMRTRAWKSP